MARSIGAIVFNGSKKTQMMSLGEYPIVGLAEARTKRDEAKSLVASGINPVEEKENQKKAKSDEYDNRVLFKHVAAEYKAEKLNNRSERYQEAFQRALDKDILKVIGDKDIKEVTSADVLTIMKKTIARVKRQKKPWYWRSVSNSKSYFYWRRNALCNRHT